MSFLATRTMAATLLSSNGQTVTISGTVDGVYDPATATVAGTTYSITAKAVILPLNPYKQRTDDNVQQGDEQMLLSALDVDGNAISKPPLNSTITLQSGATYKLISVDPLHPDGIELLFDCVVRGNA